MTCVTKYDIHTVNIYNIQCVYVLSMKCVTKYDICTDKYVCESVIWTPYVSLNMISP